MLLVILRQLLLVVVVLLVVGVGRKCRDRIIDDDTFVRVLLVLDVEHLNLLLLLLLARQEDRLWFRRFQRVIAVLDDDLDDRFRGLQVLGVMMAVMLEGLLLLMVRVISLVQVTATVRRVVRGLLLGIGIVESGSDPSLGWSMAVDYLALSASIAFAQFAASGVGLRG